MKVQCVKRLILVTILLLTAWVWPTDAAEQRKEEPEGPFARGEKLPGDLSDLLDPNKDGVVTDAEAKRAAGEFGKEANRKKKSERGQAILDALDKNEDGKVDTGEAQEAVARARIAAGGSGQAVAEIFNKLDLDANGLVTKMEFGALVVKLGVLGQLLKPRLVQLFLQLDANRDGMINVAESQMAADLFAKQAQLRAARRKATEDQKVWQMARQVMARLDTNRNGKISQREVRRDRQVAEVFHHIDTDLDKKLTGEEIFRYLEDKLSAPPPPR